MKIELTNQRSITLSVNPIFAGGIRLAATVSDLWCSELDRGVRVTFTLVVGDPAAQALYSVTLQSPP